MSHNAPLLCASAVRASLAHTSSAAWCVRHFQCELTPTAGSVCVLCTSILMRAPGTAHKKQRARARARAHSLPRLPSNNVRLLHNIDSLFSVRAATTLALNMNIAFSVPIHQITGLFGERRVGACAWQRRTARTLKRRSQNDIENMSIYSECTENCQSAIVPRVACMCMSSANTRCCTFTWASAGMACMTKAKWILQTEFTNS